MRVMEAAEVNHQCQFWSKLCSGYVQFSFSVIFSHIALTDVFQVIYVMCIVNVKHHRFAVHGSEQGRRGLLWALRSLASLQKLVAG